MTDEAIPDIRIPDALKPGDGRFGSGPSKVRVEAVERLAATDLRSVNAEVECLLREAMKARGIKLEAPAPVRRGRPPKGE